MSKNIRRSTALCLVSTVLIAGCSSSSETVDLGVPIGVEIQTEIEAVPETTPETTPSTTPDTVVAEPDEAPGELPAGDGQTESPPGTTLDTVVAEPGICTPEGINAWVDAQMRNYYIYFDQVPIVDPSEYDSPAALLNDLRVPPDIYSGILAQNTGTALFNEGETFGFGYRPGRDQQGALRFVNIVGGSPMEQAGVLRGDRLLALNGLPELDITEDLFDQIFGEFGVPTAVTFTLARGNSSPFDVTVTSAVYTINTVAEVRTYDLDGTKVGYIESSSFLRTSEAEIDRAIETLFDENPSEVILDFRYNGGGFVYIAQKFASQLVGRNLVGRTFHSTEFNRNFEQFNRTTLLEEQEIHLDLPRVIILTTRGTASASEAIANNLRPYIDVVLIGATTQGKPFASVANPNCDILLNAMDRIISNEAGETVLGGIPPTCAVTDEFLHPMSSPDDALLGAAMHYLQTNACPIVSAFNTNSRFRNNSIRAPIDSYVDSPQLNSSFDSFELP